MGVDSGDERGSVTAEFAVVIPAALLVLALGLAAIGAVVQQARLTDAAADAARSLARDDPESVARAHVVANVGPASITVERGAGDVCVSVGQAARGPTAALGMNIVGRGCALTDPGPDDPETGMQVGS